MNEVHFSIDLPLKAWIMHYPVYTNKDEYFKLRPFFSLIPPDSVGVEVGTFEGYNALGLFNYCFPRKLYCIDPYKAYSCACGDYMAKFSQSDWDELFVRTQGKLKDFNVEFIKTESVSASNRFKDEELDFVYLDGNHSIESVTNDIKHWFPKVKIGGLFGGHDILEPEVNQAVNEWAYNNDYAGKVNSQWSDWWVVKC